MNRTRPVTLLGSASTPAVAALVASLSLGVLSACGSSSSDGGTKIGHTDGTGATSGGGAGGQSSSTGGAPSMFKLDSGLLPDAQPEIIKPDAACGESTIVATPREVNI
ncbi:MAG TPA: hypothetical protein VF395_05580, partial [Polyangiaceae bacterium]